MVFEHFCKIFVSEWCHDEETESTEDQERNHGLCRSGIKGTEFENEGDKDKVES